MSLPQLIYGTAWKKERTIDLVTLAWRNGFRAFDTACQPKHYREDLVGEALGKILASGVSRNEIYIQTKFTPVSGQDAASIPYDRKLPIAAQVQQSFTVSQKNLQTEYVDALILHSPISPRPSTMEAWQALEQIHETGGAGKIGISNCYDMDLLQYLYENAHIKPSILQNRFYRDSAYDKALRHFCLQHAISYQSFWTLTANPHILAHSIVESICQQLNKTPAQILFRYLTQRGVTPLTGTCNEKHMQEDLAIVEFELDETALMQIDRLF